MPHGVAAGRVSSRMRHTGPDPFYNGHVTIRKVLGPRLPHNVCEQT